MYMFVHVDVVRFEYLARVCGKTMFEAWRCGKFVQGLRKELKIPFTFMCL